MEKNNYACYDNREFSWLKFNARVLEEVCVRSSNPLLERLKFLAIFTSNLDEFYMVRVGTLIDYVKYYKNYLDTKTNLTAIEQLAGIFAISKDLYEKRDYVYETIVLELEENGILLQNIDELTAEERKKIKKYYKKNIFPLLSPQVIDVWHPFPFLQNKKLYVGLELTGKKDNKLIGVIPVPSTLNRLVPVEENKNTYVLLERVIEYFASDIFTMYKVQDSTVLSVTRNMDIDIEYEVNDDLIDYRQYMKKLLKSRSRLAPVRFEMQKKMSKFFENFFIKRLYLAEPQVFYSNTPLDMSFAFAFESLLSSEVKDSLVYKPFKPYEEIELIRDSNLANRIFNQDLFLHYPYDSMKPFLALIK